MKLKEAKHLKQTKHLKQANHLKEARRFKQVRHEKQDEIAKTTKKGTKATKTRTWKEVSRRLWYITCPHTPRTYLFSDVYIRHSFLALNIPTRPSPTDNLLAGYSNTRTLDNYIMPILHTRKKPSNPIRATPEFSRCFRFFPFSAIQRNYPVFSISSPPSSLPRPQVSKPPPQRNHSLSITKCLDGTFPNL